MERKWYYAVDGVRHGAVTLEELRALVESGALGESALVWQPEFGPEWRTVSQARALLVPTPPPPPAEMRAADVALSGVVGARPSALASAAQAFARVSDVLFKSFDFVRWLSMGFCAWLAYISLPLGSLSEKAQTQTAVTKEMVDKLLEGLVRVVQTAPSTTWLTAAALWILLGVWLCSLRSRGDFMFLHRWYRPDAPILPSWRAASASGQALFIWRLGFYGLAGLLFALDGVFAYVKVVQPYVKGGTVWDGTLLQPTVAGVTAAVLLAVAVQVIEHLVKAFVVPVMYWRNVSPARAWLSVFDLCNQYPFSVLGYLCVGVLCSVTALVALLAFVLGTCCIGILPLMLPYFNGVALLPVTLFFRGYSVCFLSRWRPDLIPAAA